MYHDFFNRLAAPPSSLHITAFDQRGHGRTAYATLTDQSPEARSWKEKGKTVSFKPNANGKRITGGWPAVLPDMEWFVRSESERARSNGKKLFLQGFSMVSTFCLCRVRH